MDRVILRAESQVGYLEKASNKNLDDPTANPGRNNYTKYARDFKEYAGENYQGQAWCDMFLDDCFVKAYGVDNARKLLGGFSAYTPTSANYFKKMGRWYTKDPQRGDVIFFKNSQRINHTGLVYKVAGGRVYTIEGNTSGASGVVPNGGGVCRKSYDLGNSRIAGYGRPDYNIVGAKEETKKEQPAKPAAEGGLDYMRDLVKGDKDQGEIGTLQRCLKDLGFYKGEIDHSFGSKTETAVKKFQKAKGIEVNHPGTVGPKTWKVLLTEC